ncbi:MAG: adenylate/guanylate cyclase domain-containing protein [Rhodobiaceae bacterium]|nr:adenylate/guanylate cyclase domain-containing protein [Rhodobiaceae bacterium]
MERRLIAIMAADAVGYSQRMARDEAGAISALEHCRAIIDEQIDGHGGRIFGSAGDSVVAEFASSVNAVECAIAIQQQLERRRAEQKDRFLEFRIGINFGDVIVRNGNLLGDGVNVAARLESIAPVNGLCISASVHEQIRGKTGAVFGFGGERELKNIDRPVEIWCWPQDVARPAAPVRGRRKSVLIAAVAAGAVAAAAILGNVALAPDQAAPPQGGKPTLIVLPFDNLSGDGAQDYFSDGITEDLTTDISQISGIQVLARHTAFKFEGRGIDVRDLARELGVDFVLEGSVRKSAERIRINAQLIDAATGNHLWAERFDSDLKDVFAVQDKVAREIVSALTIQLTSDEDAGLRRSRTVDPVAYDLFLRGLYDFQRFTPDNNAAARALFEAAVEIDGSFARAIADIGLTHGIDLLFNWSKNPEESKRLASEYSSLASRLDPSIREVHFAMSTVHLARKNLDGAIKATNDAILIDPNYADAYAQRAQALAYDGQVAEARVSIEQAKQLNPLFPFYYVWIESLISFVESDYDKAIEISREVAEKNPAFTGARLILAASYGLSGRIDEARWEASELLVQVPDLTLAAATDRAPFAQDDKRTDYARGLELAGLE